MKRVAERGGVVRHRRRFVLGVWVCAVSMLCVCLCACSPGQQPKYKLPKYKVYPEDSEVCPYLDYIDPQQHIPCFDVTTDARNKKLLALIAVDVVKHHGRGNDHEMATEVEVVTFYDSDSLKNYAPSFAEGLVFASKDAALNAWVYEGVDLRKATHYHGAYVFDHDSGL
jgi:hypothetical protein